jgi:hypothetical protein
MKKKRHRTIDPRKAAAAAGGDPGWYRSVPVPKRGFHYCGRCHVESAAVPGPGETCLVCKLKERMAAREASV